MRLIRQPPNEALVCLPRGEQMPWTGLREKVGVREMIRCP